ncbi:MAG TPA: hypothetical protein VFS23_26675 [Vicinamibacterales bacterium]|nr:hypothetical protein [Vicinamibacterales bacterium]
MATSDVEQRPDMESGIARQIGRIGWHGLRLPILAILVVLEPIARFVLAAVALLGILLSFFLEFSGAAPRFPFWLVFGLSLSCGALVIVLSAVRRRLTR